MWRGKGICAYRHRSNDFEARSNKFASVPHYTRLTGPPNKNSIFARDVLGLGHCPATISE